ncbi:GATA transcription factor 4-like [Telopea speciosissima]|uniref:GATA transcription factor 4-like n=1 Tax=Telopea speciosissima TaxID=54955 RepID=UPI001CC3EF38|nr:GATA transcription factor 4-like [Telopea speciosissima]
MEMEMDMYGQPPNDFFHIDDLLNFSNDEIFYSSSSTPIADSDLHHHNHHLPPPESLVGNRPSPITVKRNDSSSNSNRSNNFTDDFCVSSDDVAELEWLSKFVDDSFTDFSLNEIVETTNFRPEASVPGKTRGKRSRVASTHNSWTSMPEYENLFTGKYKHMNNISSSRTARKREGSSRSASVMVGKQSSPSSPGELRKCMHCASEKTPQWRTGPLGPKTLCNACGVRYKSGRLVPEYRPAASPTFVLTQHSNSHRKVMELRSQKEIHWQQESGNHHHQNHNQQQLLYKVC